MVLGGLDTGLVGVVQSMPFPAVVTEGMGEFPISRPVFDLLKMYEGHEVSIRGAMETRGGVVRPEVIIYASYAAGDPEQEARPEFVLERGSPVRIVRGPHMGKTGTVARFPSRAKILPTGSAARGIEVQLESGEAVFAAEANVEFIG